MKVRTGRRAAILASSDHSEADEKQKGDLLRRNLVPGRRVVSFDRCGVLADGLQSTGEEIVHLVRRRSFCVRDARLLVPVFPVPQV